MSEHLERCWSCGKEFPTESGHGFSITDNGIEQVCNECWQGVPVSARLWIGFLFRASEEGGLGLADMIAEAREKYPFGGMPPGSARN